MRWIKYQVVQCTVDEEDVLVTKKVGYSEANVAIAQGEAYNGQYEIIDDEKPEPASGIVPTNLSDAIDSTKSVDDGVAATPKAVKEAYDKANAAYDKANAALPKSGGTMTGKLVAQNNTNYTTKQVRNVFLVAEGSSLPSGANGDICLVYTP